MKHLYKTPLEGNIILTDELDADLSILKTPNLYKFIWVSSGIVSLEVDDIPTILSERDIICLSPMQHLEFKSVNGEYRALLFDSRFYCIHGHDNEVSCNGFLFSGGAEPMHIKLSLEHNMVLEDIVSNAIREFETGDRFQEEMLRILLKRFIIVCTRFAREVFNIDPENDGSFDIIRQFNVLLDMNFREKKQVSDYASLLNRSSKTLSNLFSIYNLPSPLKVIHNRVIAEAQRLLLYTPKSAKEIAFSLGFEDLASFSRFFKKISGKNIKDYRTGKIANL